MREFEVGVEKRSIAAVDVDGVHLAAVQTLSKHNEDIENENAQLRGEVQALRKEL